MDKISEPLKHKRVLLVNDDGIGSIGLKKAEEALRKITGYIYVAPFRHKSGVGKALTLTRPIKVVKVGENGFCVDGTPADCVLLAIYKLLSFKPDLVVSGINLGPNLGVEDYLNSGTIGAAIEAALHNLPSLAVSYCDVKVQSERALEAAALVMKYAVEYILKRGMPKGVSVLSINIPPILKKLEAAPARIANVVYGDIFMEIRKNTYAIKSWKINLYNGEPGTDVHIVRDEGKIAVTGINLGFQVVGELNSFIRHLNSRLRGK